MPMPMPIVQLTALLGKSSFEMQGSEPTNQCQWPAAVQTSTLSTKHSGHKHSRNNNLMIKTCPPAGVNSTVCFSQLLDFVANKNSTTQCHKMLPQNGATRFEGCEDAAQQTSHWWGPVLPLPRGGNPWLSSNILRIITPSPTPRKERWCLRASTNQVALKLQELQPHL